MSATPLSPVSEVVVGLGSCGIAAGARKTYETLERSLAGLQKAHRGFLIKLSNLS